MNVNPTAVSFEFHEAPTKTSRERRRGYRADDVTVLVVEDDADTRFVYTECLSHLGYCAAGAANGERGIQAAQRLRPTVILMDLAMPGMGGIEATRHIKADPRTRDCLVIVVTAHGASMFGQAREAGCDAYFCKPFDVFALDRLLWLMKRQPDALSWQARKQVVMRCECLRQYTFNSWLALPLCGRMHLPGAGTVLEVRNCVCGSSIVMPV
jgi:CheY-like chemotaxis protein